MKFNLKWMVSAAMLALAALVVSCENPEVDPGNNGNNGNNGNELVEPELSIEVATANMLSADIRISSKALKSYAYVIDKAGAEFPEDINVIFATGEKGDLKDGQNLVNISGLEGNSEYEVVFAFVVSNDEFYEKTEKLSFRTTDYEDIFTLVSKGKNNFKMHIKVPESTKEAKNALRYVVTSLPMYNFRKSGYSPYLDSELLTLNGSHRSFVNDSTSTMVWKISMKLIKTGM